MDIVFTILLASSLVYEYFRREKGHTLIIDNLKNGIFPQSTVQKKDLLGIVLMILIGILYFAFLIFLIFFFPIRINPLFFISPVGIGIMLILLVYRDSTIYKTNRELSRGEQQ